MEYKTIIYAEQGRQDLTIKRTFELPLELLFKAYVDPEVVEQWMGTKVVKLESKNHGSWQFETKDASGKIVFQANGVIHEFCPNNKITRTFEMVNSNLPVQLEFMEFKELDVHTSELTIHIIYRSAADRDKMIQFGFEAGLNMAHNRLQHHYTN